RLPSTYGANAAVPPGAGGMLPVGVGVGVVVGLGVGVVGPGVGDAVGEVVGVGDPVGLELGVGVGPCAQAAPLIVQPVGSPVSRVSSTTNPTMTDPPASRSAFQLSFRTVTCVPSTVGTPSQRLLIRAPFGRSKARVQPWTTAPPVLVSVYCPV